MWASAFAFDAKGLVLFTDFGQINCGGNFKDSCDQCPFDENGKHVGESFCNGNCMWQNNQCIDLIVNGEPWIVRGGCKMRGDTLIQIRS